MSSEVQAKCRKLVAAATSALPAKRRCSQYSTALTSWLVVASMAFTAAPSASPNAAAAASSSSIVSGVKAGRSAMPGSAARALSHSISTLVRARIRPSSLKCPRNPATLPA